MTLDERELFTTNSEIIYFDAVGGILMRCVFFVLHVSHDLCRFSETEQRWSELYEKPDRRVQCYFGLRKLDCSLIVIQ